MRRGEIHPAENVRRLLPQSRYDDQDAERRVVIVHHVVASYNDAP
jgi:hypothetical protein